MKVLECYDRHLLQYPGSEKLLVPDTETQLSHEETIDACNLFLRYGYKLERVMTLLQSFPNESSWVAAAREIKRDANWKRMGL